MRSRFVSRICLMSTVAVHFEARHGEWNLRTRQPISSPWTPPKATQPPDIPLSGFSKIPVSVFFSFEDHYVNYWHLIALKPRTILKKTASSNVCPHQAWPERAFWSSSRPNKAHWTLYNFSILHDCCMPDWMMWPYSEILIWYISKQTVWHYQSFTTKHIHMLKD